MSSLTGLTAMQVTLLAAVRDLELENPGQPISGPVLAERLGRGPEGVHQTAASLVRGGALGRFRKGGTVTGRQVCYTITAHGSALLSREEQVHGKNGDKPMAGSEADLAAKPTVILVDGMPRSSCCQAELDIRRSVGPDVAIYSAYTYHSARDEQPAQLTVTFEKTYDNPDGGAFEVQCGTCNADIVVEVEER
jgi:hypothetical protein